MSDKIANLINKLQNAGRSQKVSVVLPFSKFSFEILKTLEKNGYVGEVSKKGKKGYTMEVKVLYDEAGQPKISGTSRVSRGARRVYFNVKDLKPVRNGFGHLIISTPKGVITGTEAKKLKVGGEPLFNIW